jgi:hypothetical protein
MIATALDAALPKGERFGHHRWDGPPMEGPLPPHRLPVELEVGSSYFRFPIDGGAGKWARSAESLTTPWAGSP